MRAQFHHGNCANWSRLGALFVAVERSFVVQNCDKGETPRQKGVLCHARQARLAHFYNHEVWWWRRCRPAREGEESVYRPNQQATGGDLVSGQHKKKVTCVSRSEGGRAAHEEGG